MKGSAVTLSAVAKHYDKVVAVETVSLDVEAGEFLSLLGPSGSGKTTLLMMIAGFEAPSSGSIRIGTRDVTNVPPNKREVGMVFQRYALFPHMSVAKNVAFPLKMRGVPRAEIARRVEAALTLVRLEQLAARLPSQLSGGQQQRVALARAIVFEPPVLLMDEPLGALDKKLREQLQIEIKRLQQRLGVTVIYVTHDQEEALTMSDRIAVMDHGRLEQVGTPLELYSRPATPFVADFIGKMNFLAGALETGERGVVLRLPHGAPIALGPAAPAGAGPVRAAIRPEEITLAPNGSGGPAAVPGTVETAIFVGAHQVYLVRVGAELLHVQVPSEAARRRFAENESVDVTLAPGALHLFPAEAA